ncbi:MAG: bifunctional folylpolyglutamate synthase/dihydrofolate synthase [Thermovirgaceae bacterium]
MKQRNAAATAFDEVEKRLMNLANPGIRPGLSRIAGLLEGVGHPERSFLAVHVVGTNGKGSTSVLIESVLRHAGYRTALYTSPHLTHFGERLRVGGELMEPGAWHHAIDLLEPVLHKTGEAPTFFEVSTAAAFLLAATGNAEIAVVEAGLGGRLDATNILSNVLVSVLTAIGLDHGEYLGDSLTGVAEEKFAVLRPSGKSCFAGGNEQLEKMYSRRCRLLGNDGVILSSAATWTVRKTDPEGTLFDVSFMGKTYRNLQTGLIGVHQAANAVNAIAALTRLPGGTVPVTEENMRAGFRKARLAGRFDIRRTKDHTVILDGAHNPQGTAALVKTISDLSLDGEISIVFASMKDKDYCQSLDLLKKTGGSLFLTRVSGMERSAEPTCLLEAALHGTGWPAGVKAVESPAEALEAALKKNRTVLCCGSLYLLSEILTLIEPEETT